MKQRMPFKHADSMLDVNAQFNNGYGFRVASLLTVTGFPASLILSFLFWDNLDLSFY